MDDSKATMDSLTLSNASQMSVEECIAAQQAIDTQIDEISSGSSSNYHRKLRARRNAYALINAWFPPELMVAIFYEVVISSRYPPYFAEDIPCYGFKQEWVVFSHVCQIWRTIAVGTPRLWEAVSLVNSNITALMLQRSMASPISIYCNSHKPDEPITGTAPIVQVLSHADRAFEIDLNMCASGLRNLICTYLAMPMPFLKQLRLSIFNKRTDDAPCLLPRGCLEEANNLSRLDLFYVGLPPESILSTTLTELRLHQPPEKLTTSQMVALLEPLEALRDLHIICSLQLDAPNSAAPRDQRRLSPRTSLNRLQLSAPARERNDFMNRFPITSKTQTTLVCCTEMLEDLRFGQLLQPVYGARGLLRRLDISYSHGIAILAYVHASPEMMPLEMCFGLFALPDEDAGVLPDETLRDLCNMIPLDSIETLVVSTPDRWELTQIMARLLASHLSGVRTLRVKQDSMKHILRVMHPEADEHGPAFPSLRSLTMDDKSRNPDKELLQVVVDCLVARKASGKTVDVEELEINGWRVPPERLQELESLKD